MEIENLTTPTDAKEIEEKVKFIAQTTLGFDANEPSAKSYLKQYIARYRSSAERLANIYVNNMDQEVPVEAEVKLLLTEVEYNKLPATLVELGFLAAEPGAQIDYYIEHEASDLGGMNFSRLRREGGVHTWNQKRHALDANGEKVRLEETKDLSQQEFNALLSQAPSTPIVIRKQRQNYTGTIEQWPATVSLDVVAMNGETKYFIEVEIMTDVAHGFQVRTLCKAWAEQALGILGPESPGYLKQYLSSLQG